MSHALPVCREPHPHCTDEQYRLTLVAMIASILLALNLLDRALQVQEPA